MWVNTKLWDLQNDNEALGTSAELSKFSMVRTIHMKSVYTRVIKGLVKGTFEKMWLKVKTCAKAVTRVEACQPIRNAFLILENEANFS